MTPEQQLEVVEAMSGICDLLDTLKVGLEDRGWQPTLAAQAAILVGGPVSLAGSTRGGNA